MELRCPPHSAAGKAPTALRVQVRGIALLRRLGAYAQQGGQCNALATGRGFGASRIRRPEKRRPPYGYRFAASALLRRLGAYAQQGGQCNALATGRGFGAPRIQRPEKRRPPYGYRFAASRCCVGSALMPSRVANATHWPPDAASVHPAFSGRKSADRPTATGSRHRAVASARRLCPVGWSMQRIGHRTAASVHAAAADSTTPSSYPPQCLWPNASPSSSSCACSRICTAAVTARLAMMIATVRSGQALPVPNTPSAASSTARLPRASLRVQSHTLRMLLSPSR